MLLIVQALRVHAEGAAQSQEVLGHETHGQGTGHGVLQFYSSFFPFCAGAEGFFSVIVVDQRICCKTTSPKLLRIAGF
jgi:hypothetical protein